MQYQLSTCSMKYFKYMYNDKKWIEANWKRGFDPTKKSVQIVNVLCLSLKSLQKYWGGGGYYHQYKICSSVHGELFTSQLSHLPFCVYWELYPSLLFLFSSFKVWQLTYFSSMKEGRHWISDFRIKLMFYLVHWCK